MRNNRQLIGKEGEKIAYEFLKKEGYDIIATNYRCLYGEIDIIAFESDFLVFIEVKTRKNLKYGFPEEAVTKRKQEKLVKVASYYMNICNIIDRKIRFDVISILKLGNKKTDFNIKLIKGAF